MSRYLLIQLLSLVMISVTQAQTKIYQATIQRDDYQVFYLVDGSQDSLLIDHKVPRYGDSKDHAGYTFVDGVGRKKDQHGTREKYKTYLIDSSSDTLMSISPEPYTYRFADGAFATRRSTDEGWTFFDDSGNVISEVKLIWNEARWMYTINNYQQGGIVELINHYTFSNLTNWAHHKSRRPSGGRRTDRFWLYMLLLEVLE